MAFCCSQFRDANASSVSRSPESILPSLNRSAYNLIMGSLMTIEGACINYESKLLESRSRIIETEAKGESALQRNWRPLLMCICMFIIFSNYVLVPFFGIPPTILDDHIWSLMEMGVGGYVAGRSLEKITEKLGPVLVNTKKGRV
jgi:hypothetical protein